MANQDPAAVLAKLGQARYAARFKEVFGQNSFVNHAKAMYAIERVRTRRSELSSVHKQVRL
jgi:cytochrome c peroxidase